MAYVGGDPVTFRDRTGGIMQYAGTGCDMVYNSDYVEEGWDCEDYYSGGGPYEPDTPPAQTGGGTYAATLQQAGESLVAADKTLGFSDCGALATFASQIGTLYSSNKDSFVQALSASIPAQLAPTTTLPYYDANNVQY